MSTDHLLPSLPSLASMIDRQPLTVSPNTSLRQVAAHMAQAQQSCALVTADAQLIGIFTTQDLLAVLANQTNFPDIPVATVMTNQPPALVVTTTEQSISIALQHIQHQHSEYLPIVNPQHHLLGLVTLKQLMSAVEKAQAQFIAQSTALLTTAPVGIFQTDPDGNCLFVNQRYTHITGLSPENATGQGWVNALHPDDCERVFAEWHQAIQAKREFALEYRFVTPHGQINWVFGNAIAIYEPSGLLTGYVGTLTNITDRKANEQKIQQQAALIDVSTDAIIVRSLENQIQFWNQGAEAIFGWSAPEAIGRVATQLFYLNPQTATAMEEAFQAVLRQGSWQGELQKITKAGEEVVVESRWTLMRDEINQPQSILSVDTDITEKKLLQKQFLRAQRLESLGTLASGIAHDLNNVLTPILGAAQLLPHTLPHVDERNQKLLNMLVESAKRGSSLIKQILTFARGIDGQRTILQVRHILAEIVSVARQTFPKSIDIILNVDTTDLWLINVDATQIHQVLMNLFVNARDAMPNGGVIMATAENLVIDPAYAKMHINAQVGSYVVITVADSGVGMTSDVLENIFDPFFTTKESGTGLGLSTVLGIIKSHGGFINVYSEVDRGSRFQIYLPALIMSESIVNNEPPATSDGHKCLILVVDDEAAVREITKDSLEAYNYQVILAGDGIEAISVYTQYQQAIAAVLLDMTMPMLNTPAIIRSLQQINPHVAIIVMSGLAANREVVQTLGAKAFLTKPFTTAEMLQVLTKTIGDEIPRF